MNKLRMARKARGMTLIEVAKSADTDAGNLSRIERSRQFPTPELAIRLCHIYGVSLDDIYRVTPEGRPT